MAVAPGAGGKPPPFVGGGGKRGLGTFARQEREPFLGLWALGALFPKWGLQALGYLQELAWTAVSRVGAHALAYLQELAWTAVSRMGPWVPSGIGL